MSACALFLTVSGCGGSALREDGPLDFGGTQAVCMIGDQAGEVTLGERIMDHRGSEVVTVTGVELVNPVDIEVLDSMFVPVPEQKDGDEPIMLIGARRGWPPASAESDPPANWEERTAADGTALEPGSRWNLVLGLRSTGPDAAADAVRVLYRDNAGTEYVAPYETEVRIRDEC